MAAPDDFGAIDQGGSGIGVDGLEEAGVARREKSRASHAGDTSRVLLRNQIYVPRPMERLTGFRTVCTVHSTMARIQRRAAEEARAQLPTLLADAENGRTTIITRHGRSVAALVPVQNVGGGRQRPLTELAGSGKGLWGRDGAAAVPQLRNEWNR